MRALRSRLGALLPRGQFLRNVTVLAGGSGAGQAIALLAAPVLTRLYEPQQFGVFAVYVSLLGILSVVATLRYELAIPLAADEDTALNVVAASLLVVIVMTMLSTIAVAMLGSKLTTYLNIADLEPYLWLLPVGLLMAGLFQTVNYYALRKKAFGTIARTHVSRSTSLASSQLGLGLLQVGTLGLLIGHLVGQIAGTTALARGTLAGQRKGLKRVSLKSMRSATARYIRFPLLSSWAAAFNTLSTQTPVLLLSMFFGPAVTGLYALGRRVLQTPMLLVGQAIGQVFFSGASEAIRAGRIRQVTDEVFGRLVTVSMPIAILLAIGAPEAFALVFGEPWRHAGVYVQWLTPWLFFAFVAAPLSTLPSALEKQGHELAFQGTLLAARVAALVVGGTVGDPTLAVALFGSVSALYWCGFMFWNLNQVGNRPLPVAARLSREAMIVLPLTAPALVVKLVVPGDLHVLAVSAVSAAAIALRAARLG